MQNQKKLLHCFLSISFSFFFLVSSPARSSSQEQDKGFIFRQSKNYEGSSDLIDVNYHMGPVLASPVSLYIIWYGQWSSPHQSTIRDFISSISAPSSSSSSSSTIRHPSVSDWWQTVRLYTDQTGSNITDKITLVGELADSDYSHGRDLTRLSMQSIIKTAVSGGGMPLNTRDGIYLVLTSHDVVVQDFCRAVCGFHYFTFPYLVGAAVPYAWVGYSGTQCPGMCAYPFAWPTYSGGKRPPNNNIMKSPNGDAGIDGMISVIAHELAEVSSNPLVNSWYAGDDPINPTEIADLCLGVYGTGAGGGYVGQVMKDAWGDVYNVNGVKGRKFLLQWVWNPARRRCFGPNARERFQKSMYLAVDLD